MSVNFPTERKVSGSDFKLWDILAEVVNALPTKLSWTNLEVKIQPANLINHSIWTIVFS